MVSNAFPSQLSKSSKIKMIGHSDSNATKIFGHTDLLPSNRRSTVPARKEIPATLVHLFDHLRGTLSICLLWSCVVSKAFANAAGTSRTFLEAAGVAWVLVDSVNLLRCLIKGSVKGPFGELHCIEEWCRRWVVVVLGRERASLCNFNILGH
ncbi:Hypothetical predicted protein [Prunus dulcis]|uniref:Uncharacterized protein n=1 Tax=Prunus dulcis TaxID=3755 RepID=A0A5E4EX59_PRUDU|nr:Hypothetical predicted protein [Prunus dulcis]